MAEAEPGSTASARISRACGNKSPRSRRPWSGRPPSTAEREAGEVRGREIQDVLAQRLATVERRVEELGDGVTGLEVGTAALAEQFARLEAGTVAAVSPPRSRPGARQPGPPISPEELFDRGMESYRAGGAGAGGPGFRGVRREAPRTPPDAERPLLDREAYFRSRDFEQAASRYQKAIDLAATGIAHRMPFSAWAWRSGRSIARTGPARSGPGSSGLSGQRRGRSGRAVLRQPGGRFARRSLASPGSRPTLPVRMEESALGPFLDRPSVFLTSLGASVYDGACFANV